MREPLKGRSLVTYSMAAGNGEEGKREDSQVIKPKRLSHSPTGEEPFGLRHIYLLNISKFGPDPMEGLRPMFNDMEKFCLGLKRKAK